LFESKEIGITILELYPIYVLIGVFGHKIRNSTILFHSDNTGVVEVINKQTSSSKVAMRIVRPLVLLLIKHNIGLRSVHVPGIENVVPDTISRFQETPEFLMQHGMQLHPEEIPHQFKSSNFRIRQSKTYEKPGVQPHEQCTTHTGPNSKGS
jgi:hypothetical protein